MSGKDTHNHFLCNARIACGKRDTVASNLPHSCTMHLKCMWAPHRTEKTQLNFYSAKRTWTFSVKAKNKRKRD